MVRPGEEVSRFLRRRFSGLQGRDFGNQAACSIREQPPATDSGFSVAAGYFFLERKGVR